MSSDFDFNVGDLVVPRHRDYGVWVDIDFAVGIVVNKEIMNWRPAIERTRAWVFWPSLGLTLTSCTGRDIQHIAD